jgi:maltose O-acetyltransferase
MHKPSRGDLARWTHNTLIAMETPRAWRLRLLGVKIAPGARVCRGTRFLRYQSELGTGSMLGIGCYIEDHAPVVIGDKVWIGAGSQFMTATHSIGPSDDRAGPVEIRPIRVGNGCWVGARVTVLSGVTIGAGCIIAAGAVVTKDCEPDGLYAGVPAVRKRDLH